MKGQAKYSRRLYACEGGDRAGGSRRLYACEGGGYAPVKGAATSPREGESGPQAKPFLKWAGGKQQLLAQYERYFPASFTRYVEPFIGGGAVFFHLWNTGRLPDDAFLFDNNEELINTYVVVRDKVDDLIQLLIGHREKHSREYFYQIRNLDRQNVSLSDVERAARTIYLNKTCYNGLHRVNSRGQFNAPLGSYKNPQIFHEGSLRAASIALQNADLAVRDFRALPDFALAGDFVYFDPPYDPVSRTSSFTGYTAGSFGEDDQRQLAEVFARLSEKGCLCMLSNSHTPLILRLYDKFRIGSAQANRMINSVATGRGSIREVVVLSY